MSHPIFDDIEGGNQEEVQRRVRADAVVLEERLMWGDRWTPLIFSIMEEKLTITLWLIEHRGQHDLDSIDRTGWTALHCASMIGMLSVVKALVGAGANPAAMNQHGATPLFWAVNCNPITDDPARRARRADIVAFLLQQPAVKATIDAVTQFFSTALSRASCQGMLSNVQILLHAGANPTIPAGPESPLNKAIAHSHHDIAALLRTAIAEPDHARALHKARTLLNAGPAVTKASADARKKDVSVAAQQRAMLAAVPECLKGRVAWGKELPMVETCQQPRQQQQQEPEPEAGPEADKGRLRATAAFVLGFDGDEYKGLPQELYVELLRFMLPRWADKEPGE